VRAGVLVAVLLGACGGARRADTPASPPAIVTSNVARADYAGSASCEPCHAEIVAKWQKTPMHNMTRVADRAAIAAPFDGTVFHFKQDYVTLELHNGVKYMRLETVEKGTSLFRVTKVIGGRHREDFAGVLMNGDEVVDPEEKILPVSFMRATKELRYKGYSVMEKERPSLRASGEWRKRCIFCHNTEPYLDAMLGGFGAKAYQGVVVDTLLPESKRASYQILDVAKFRDALYEEVKVLDANDAVIVARTSGPMAAIETATSSFRARYDGKHLLEVGIGCESCHGGSKEHVLNPRSKPSYSPRAPYLSVTPPAGTDARAQSITRTCARCHQVLFSAYAFTWEGGLRAMTPGGSNINSGEARDFLLGGCASKMTCTACHDPHSPSGTPRADDGVCIGCHAEKKGAAHSHHDTVTCVGCHMPRKNMGLAGKLNRYHRIGSPTDAARVEKDRPLECALCHEKKTANELVTSMEQWWGKKFDRKALEDLYGDLDGSPLLATLSRGKPHEQAVAIAVAGETRLRPAVPFLVPHATHSIPLLRYWTVDALTAIVGGPSGVDLHRDTAEIAKKTRAWVSGKGFVLP
jgi:hypothetical protein